MPQPLGLTSIHVRNGNPDFLDLPWHLPLARWKEETHRVVERDRGLSRHDVRFVEYEGTLYACKQMTARAAEREYKLLRKLEDEGLPAVIAVGHARARTEGGQGQRSSVLITRYLDHSRPYRTLFMNPHSQHLNGMLDAMAGLLVQLHVADFYWGDCSLSNTLFLRDAHALQAILVDAETSEFPEKLTDGHREQDLMVMRDNLQTELRELGDLPDSMQGINIRDTPAIISARYHALWEEITRVEFILPHETYRIHKRISRLADLGFSVSEFDLEQTEDGSQLRLHVVVADRDYHPKQLRELTGIIARQHEAALLLGEIQEVRAMMEREAAQSVSMNAAAHRWQRDRYYYAMKRLEPLGDRIEPGPGTYCELLESKWLLSEDAGRDVGLDVTIDDYLRQHSPPVTT